MVIKFEVEHRVWWEVYKEMLECGFNDIEIEVEDMSDIYGILDGEDEDEILAASYSKMISAKGVSVTEDRIVRLFDRIKIPINSGEVRIIKIGHA